MAEGVVRYQRDGAVATVIFDRPEARNAMTWTMYRQLTEACERIASDAQVRVAVLRGAGGKAFIAGTDIAQFREFAGAEDGVRYERDMERCLGALESLPVPTLALVQGACFGGGTGILAACDIVIAAEDAMFSISETRWGLMAGIILPQLADAIGARQVRRYALSGERFGAREACRIGLVHEVVPAVELQAAGERMVDQLLQNAPEANAQTKAAALEFAWGAVDEAALERLVVQHAAKRRSAEATEGLASFAEKRPARWA